MRTPALVQLLYSEIEILKTLKHANILNCLEVFTSANNCYIITEVCNDGDLETRLRKTGYID
jgi:serine/threonine protein kinase